MSIPFRLDEAKVREGLAHLQAVDKHFARAIALHGPPPLRVMEEGFASLLRAIMGQQVSVHAARAIWERLERTAGTVTPQRILELEDAHFRTAGLSGAKMRYARALAQDTAEGRIDFPALSALDDDAVVAMLTQAKGIGRWTAEMYLMFALGRPDIMPGSDLGLIVAAQHLKGLRKRPEPKRLLKLAEAWKPWRSVAALFLWHYRRTMPDWSEGRSATPRAPAPAPARKTRAAPVPRRKTTKKKPAAKRVTARSKGKR